MKKEKTIKENIKFLIDMYKRELELENDKPVEKRDITHIEDMVNIIIELEFALDISKGE